MFRPLLVLLMSLPLPAMADTLFGRDVSYAVTVGASTLGVTVEPSIRLNPNWGIRAPLGGGTFGLDDTSNGQDYDGDLDSFGIGLIGDYHPFANGFRVSAGAFYTDYKADISSDNVAFGDISSKVDATIKQRENFVPVVAVGYDGAISSNGMLSLTVGGMFGNGFDVSASESSGLVPQELVDAEIQEIRDDLDDFDVLPYIQISVGFRF